MRAALAAVLLLGFTAHTPTDDYEIRITSDHPVVIENVAGNGGSVRLAGPHVSIPLDESLRFRVVDLDGSGVPLRYSVTTKRVTFEGSYQIKVARGGETEGHVLVEDAVVEVGRFAEGEGWPAR